MPGNETNATVKNQPRRGKGKKKKAKRYLQASAQQKWDSLPKNLEDYITSSLTQVLAEEELQRSRERKGKNGASKDGDPEEAAERKLKWSYFYCGINAVTRALERDGVCLVLSDSGAHPEMLTSHLPALSVSRSVPAAAVDLSMVADALAVQRLACIAITRLDNIKHNSIRSVAESLCLKLGGRMKAEPLDEVKMETTKPEPLSPGLCAASEDSDEGESNSGLFKLPPEDIPFTSLYVYKNNLNFKSQEDYIQLTDVYKDVKTTRPQPMKQTSKLLRYMKTSIGQVKINPNRPDKSKSKNIN